MKQSKEIKIQYIINMDEIFKVITDYKNYLVSNLGRVMNQKNGRILKPSLNSEGYLIVSLYTNCLKKTKTIHNLVASAFLETPDNKLCIDHKDNNRQNNNIDNLRYATHSENSMNQKIRKNNTSGIKGVKFNKQRNNWTAEIMLHNKCIHIGSYNTIEEATTARQIKANELFGEYTNQCEKLIKIVDIAQDIIAENVINLVELLPEKL